MFRQLVTFAAPLFLSNLLQIVYNMVDMIIVGQKMGSVGLSAVAVGGDVSNFMTLVAMGFSNAAQVIIAQLIGMKRRKDLGRFIGTLFMFLFLIAIIISTVCMILRSPILHVMNTPPESYTEALHYATVCMCGLIFIYGYNASSAILRGMGDSTRPFIFISMAAGINVCLDLVFVMGLGLGAGGAALATVISQAFSFSMCSIFLFRNRERYSIEVTRREFFHIDRALLGKLVKLGLPMAELALRCLFSKPEPKSILTGVETVEQLKENIRIAALPPLGEADLRAVDEIAFPELPEMCVSPFFWPRYKKEHDIR